MNRDTQRQVRVRYAPSPTGYLHVGGARALLFNWLFAKKHGGTLVLRIEDTDQARSTREFEGMILADIRRLGVDYQEGPDVGGPFGPYRQSERMTLYAEHAKKLLDSDKAYYCFCPEEMLTQKRQSALKLGRVPHYDGTCAKISRTDAERRLATGERAGLRFRAPHKDYALDDRVRERVEFKAGIVGDFFITRTPTEAKAPPTKAGVQRPPAGASHFGMPVYNFCCVIDDHLMQISHVIRGEDHLSNTARQLMIYDAFGWETPEFAHTAMVLGADRQKLSKRSGDVSVFEYTDQGYLPDALINFLALLGWWPPAGIKPASGHPEILSREEMISTFSLEGLHKSPAVFDVQKLKWMNAYYLRKMAASDLVKLALPFFERAGVGVASLDAGSASWQGRFEKIIEAVKSEATLLSDVPGLSGVFFDSSLSLDQEAKAALLDPGATKVIDALVSELKSDTRDLSSSDVEALQKKLPEVTGLKGKALFMPMRAAITGKIHGPELKKLLPIIGRAEALRRIMEFKRQATQT